MSSFLAHTVACLVRLMHLLKVLLLAWLWPGCEKGSHTSDHAIARKPGGVKHLNRSVEYEEGYFIAVTCALCVTKCMLYWL